VAGIAKGVTPLLQLTCQHGARRDASKAQASGGTLIAFYYFFLPYGQHREIMQRAIKMTLNRLLHKALVLRS
jgi:hypothetical protein